jgi:hypothetical protein
MSESLATRTSTKMKLLVKPISFMALEQPGYSLVSLRSATAVAALQHGKAQTPHLRTNT